MSGQPANGGGSTKDFLVNLLRRLVMLLAGVAGAGLFAMAVLVTLYHLFHPGKTLLKP